MQLLMPLVTLVMAAFAVCVMSYLALATSVGPWIEPTLVLFATILLRLVLRQQVQTARSIGFAVIASSVGGILATALCFSFPTLFFLEPALFKAWMREPFYFSFLVSSLCLAGGLFGYLVANLIEKKLIYEQRLLFPVGVLVYRMIAAQDQLRKAKELGAGILATFAFCAVQRFTAWIPKFVVLIQAVNMGSLQLPQLRFDIFPLMWAVGFVTGHVVALPLLCGAMTKILAVDLVGAHFFPQVTAESFTLAFCSGMALVSAVLSFIKAPILMWYTNFSHWIQTQAHGTVTNWREVWRSGPLLGGLSLPSMLVLLLLISGFLTYFQFSFWAQLYLLGFALVATYQIANIAGKIGLAYLGRFATFVMIPALFLFDLSRVQLTILCSFVEISGGVAADMLFGRKIAQLAQLPSAQVRRYQLWGLLACCLFAGIILWVLGHNLHLGSLELFAQRSQARALLIDIGKFDTYVMLLGAVFGGILQYLDWNPMIILGGILMPLNLSLSLITGGVFAHFTKHKEQWFPFWSGVFAAQSIWMVLSIAF